MKSNKGFSLVELIVVIAIMAIIAGVAIPVYSGYITKANEGTANNTAGEIVYNAKLLNYELGTTATYTVSGTGTGAKISVVFGGDKAAKAATDLVAIFGGDATTTEGTAVITVDYISAAMVDEYVTTAGTIG